MSLMYYFINLFNKVSFFEEWRQLVVCIGTLFLGMAFSSAILRCSMVLIARQIQNLEPNIKYICASIAKANIVSTTVLFVLLCISFGFDLVGMKHGIIDFVASILSLRVVLKSIAIVGRKRGSSLVTWLITLIILVHDTEPGQRIKYGLESIRFSIVDLNVSLYGALKAIMFSFALVWFISVVLNAGKKIIYYRAIGNNDKSKVVEVNNAELQYKIFSYVTYFATAIIFLTIIGVKSSHIAMVGSAIGVGLGFGLQRIAADLVSGFILLMEKNIEVGDILELDEGQVGIVKSFGVRSMVITAFDGKDFVIPNEMFTSKKAISYTLTNNKLRCSANFQIVNKQDVRIAIELMRKACLMQKDLSRKDPVVCTVRDVTERGILLMALFWIRDFAVDDVIRIKSNIYTTTLELFLENGIELYLDRSTAVLRDTLHAITATRPQLQGVPLVNRFENSPISVAPQATDIAPQLHQGAKYSDLTESGWSKRNSHKP